MNDLEKDLRIVKTNKASLEQQPVREVSKEQNILALAYDPCVNCAEKLMGIAGEPCIDCSYATKYFS